MLLAMISVLTLLPKLNFNLKPFGKKNNILYARIFLKNFINLNWFDIVLGFINFNLFRNSMFYKRFFFKFYFIYEMGFLLYYYNNFSSKISTMGK